MRTRKFIKGKLVFSTNPATIEKIKKQLTVETANYVGDELAKDFELFPKPKVVAINHQLHHPLIKY